LNISEFWELRISYMECIIYFETIAINYLWDNGLWLIGCEFHSQRFQQVTIIIIISIIIFFSAKPFENDLTLNISWRLDMGFSSVGQFTSIFKHTQRIGH
jgi:hypothetical protein